MLGRTAGSLYWMMRYLERAENIARLIESGFQISLTAPSGTDDVWHSIIQTAGVDASFYQSHDEATRETVVDYLLRDKSHSFSIVSMLEMARDNARAARTALTRELWEATNQAWLESKESLKRPISMRALPLRLEEIRKHTSLVRGAVQGTMLRNDIFDFLHLGATTERLEATARILDVKYYVLLPSILDVGSNLDNIQWESILRSVSAFQSYRWLHQGAIDAASIANYLIFDKRFPRSIAHCASEIQRHLRFLEQEYDAKSQAQVFASDLNALLNRTKIEEVISSGLHEFLQDMIARNVALSQQIEQEFRFYG